MPVLRRRANARRNLPQREMRVERHVRLPASASVGARRQCAAQGIALTRAQGLQTCWQAGALRFASSFEKGDIMRKTTLALALAAALGTSVAAAQTSPGAERQPAGPPNAGDTRAIPGPDQRPLISPRTVETAPSTTTVNPTDRQMHPAGPPNAGDTRALPSDSRARRRLAPHLARALLQPQPRISQHANLGERRQAGAVRVRARQSAISLRWTRAGTVHRSGKGLGSTHGSGAAVGAGRTAHRRRRDV